VPRLALTHQVFFIFILFWVFFWHTCVLLVHQGLLQLHGEKHEDAVLDDWRCLYTTHPIPWPNLHVDQQTTIPVFWDFAGSFWSKNFTFTSTDNVMISLVLRQPSAFARLTLVLLLQTIQSINVFSKGTNSSTIRTPTHCHECCHTVAWSQMASVEQLTSMDHRPTTKNMISGNAWLPGRRSNICLEFEQSIFFSQPNLFLILRTSCLVVQSWAIWSSEASWHLGRIWFIVIADFNGIEVREVG
jgi:hypothetical protein